MNNDTANKLLPNTTQVPNILLDEYIKLPGTEFKILMIIARQTYGWHKESDQIAYTQIITKTGQQREAVAHALKSLREQGLILVTDAKGTPLYSKEQCRGKKLYYKINLTSSEIELVEPNQFDNRTSIIELTKETNTKAITNVIGGDSVRARASSQNKCHNPLGHTGCVENLKDIDREFGKNLLANAGKNLKYQELIFKGGGSDATIQSICNLLDKDPFYQANGWDMKTVFDHFSKGRKP